MCDKVQVDKKKNKNCLVVRSLVIALVPFFYKIVQLDLPLAFAE